jgi:hypothetical protein
MELNYMFEFTEDTRGLKPTIGALQLTICITSIAANKSNNHQLYCLIGIYDRFLDIIEKLQQVSLEHQ